MSRSNIALAIIAGAVIGGAVALFLTAGRMLDEDPISGEEEYEGDEEHPMIESIARQFSERISSELKTAEEKIKSAVKKAPGPNAPEGEFGVFL